MWDVLIVGAGPCGLMAAIYLGRFRRKVLVIDGGTSRARWIPESHNIPGFYRGIGGRELLAQMKAQAQLYGARVHAGRVDTIAATNEAFQTRVGSELFKSSYLILATGVGDHLPAIAGAQEAILHSRLRICPICDAYEAIGRRIAVIGRDQHADREAEFLTTYSASITLIHTGPRRDRAAIARLNSRGIEVIEATLEAIELNREACRLRLPHGGFRAFDVCYTALGYTPRHQLAVALGAHTDDSGALIVNEHQETSVAKVYAAGDVVRGLSQVVVAAGEAAIAATDIHNRLRASSG